MAIEVNYEGMRALRSAMAKNERYLRTTHTFITENCADFDAFSGFLTLFKGDYKDAYNNAEQSVAKGRSSAGGIKDNIESNKKRYQKDDIESSRRLKAITVDVTLPQIPGMTPESGPIVTKGDKNTSSASGIIEDLDDGVRDLERESGIGPRHRGPLPGNPLTPIGLLGETESLVSTTQSGAQAGKDEQDYEDFENEGQK